MRNTLTDKFNSNVKILVEGKNINNFIKRIIKLKISIINLKYHSSKKAEIIIKYDDYLKLKKYKTIYSIKIIDKYGKLKLKEKIKKNYILFTSLLIGLIIIIFLTNFIFDIEIIHTNKQIVNLVSSELEKNGIKKYIFKKKYSELEKIEDKILKDNKDKLEWLEIEVVGTKYVVRIEERKIVEEKTNNNYQNIVMSKGGILKKIIAYSGEKVKEINTYVNANDIVISGNITKPNGEIIQTKASGLLYAEVWYTIEVEYPYHYKEELLTGKAKDVYYINFLNKRISLFDFKKFNSFSSKPKTIIKNTFLPISFIKEKQYELNVIDEIYTEEEVIDKAIQLAENKLLNNNNKIEEINSVSIITKENLNSKIKLKLFLSVTEEVSKIEIPQEEKSNLDN